MSKTPNHLGERKTEHLGHVIWAQAHRARLLKHPHEHDWAKDFDLQIAIALVSGWVGQGKVAIRFVNQHDRLWHIYTYPHPVQYLGTKEDPT